MRQATTRAAASISSAASFLERYVDDGLAAAIAELWPGATPRVRSHLELLDWERLRSSASSREPRRRESDLQVQAPGDSAPSLLSEQKVWDLDASLFDVAKLLSFARLPGVISTYLVAAGRPAHFAGPGAGRALYADGSRRWPQTDLATGPWQEAWSEHLRNGGVAPRQLPMFFTTTLIASAQVAGFRDHELRCVRVDGDLDGPVAYFDQGQLLLEQPPELHPDDDAIAREINDRSFRESLRRRT